MMKTNVFVPMRFKRVIALHVVKNSLSQERIRAPLILGIHGPSGEGKTFQCEYVLKEMDVKLFLISGGQLESSHAGEPARLLRSTYLKANHYIEKGEHDFAVILINDVDTGLGNWGELVQYTINRQTVFGELMHLADYPTSIQERTTKRIPVIVTGNDFTKLYAPLVRVGRMTFFEWEPTFKEKVKILSRIFPEITLAECETLLTELESEVEEFSDGKSSSLPVAFFSHLRSVLVDRDLWREIQRIGIKEVPRLISSGLEPEVEPDIHLNQLISKGRMLIKTSRLSSHLE